MGLPEQLKKARLDIGYTQQQVADIMGITKSTYCGYETGKRQPDVAKIKQLASVLNTSGDILLETGFGEDIPQTHSLFADNLKLLLKDRNLKQADLCRMTGIQTSLISDYLGGKKSPTIGNAILIADALNISLDTLVGKDTYSSPEEQQESKMFFESEKKLSNNPNISDAHRYIIMQLEKMNDAQVRAVLAFMNSLDEVEKNIQGQNEKQ